MGLSFIRKINELTPQINFAKSGFSKFKQNTNPLQFTKDIYKKRNKFEERELKEFSILYLSMNNLDIFRKNIELISEINFSTNLTNEFKQKLVDHLLSEKYFNKKKLTTEDFDEKFKKIIDLINNNAEYALLHRLQFND